MPYIDIEEFIDAGYLQEVNRQFFHPLGLALTVAAETDDDTGEQVGPWVLSGVQDFREDPEGMFFAEDTLSREKADKVAAEQAKREVFRRATLGFFIQPV